MRPTALVLLVSVASGLRAADPPPPAPRPAMEFTGRVEADSVTM